jgi:serine/threonine protein kinase
MTPEEWQRVRPILESALELDPAHRTAYLDGACADRSLRREVESLIAAHEQAGTDFLSSAPVPGFVAEDEARFRLPPGKRIGAYEILEEIAVGGMGAVYRAIRADGQYKQQVALKIIRSDLGPELTATRFRNERQILASLEHPNIAKILDGGTTVDGLPYFVMELIDGLPITEYCDQQKLPIDGRLKMFRTVCSAVHYAHQHLVIHRDIKPGNILITAEGTPKLLDFGIAKILDPSLLPENMTMTAAGQWMMTPEYASPEQLRGEAITTATDVYSLGLVLYQLLAGHRACRFASRLPHEIARAVLETEPEKPSSAIRRKERAPEEKPESGVLTPEIISDRRSDSPERLHRRLAGDLDNIALKAIRKEPGARYTSADQLSEDIRRHLEGLPVVARKSTVAYRCRKYVLRHKVGVTAAALVFLSLLAGIVVTLREARIARANQLRAEKRFNDVRALANSLIFDIHDGISQLPGSTPVREVLVKKALLYLDSLSQESSGDSALQRELASAYDRVGSLQWSSDFANQGDSVGALQSRRKALAIRESLATANPNDSKIQVELTDEYIGLADAIESTGDFAGALDVLHKIPPLLEKATAHTSDPRLLDRQAGSYYYTGRLLNEMGDPAGALENYRKAAAIHESTNATDPDEVNLLRTHVAGDYAGMAESMMLSKQLNDASKVQEQAVQILEELSRSKPNSVPLRQFLANSYDLLGTIWDKQSDHIKALKSRRRAHEIFEEMMTSDPKNALARTNFAFSDESLGESLVAAGDLGEALQHIREALAVFQSAAASGSKDRYVSSGMADCYFAYGMVYSALADKTKGSGAQQTKRWHEARAWYQKSLDIWTEKRTGGSLDGSERETAERAAQGIAKCDAALAKLGTPIR